MPAAHSESWRLPTHNEGSLFCKVHRMMKRSHSESCRSKLKDNFQKNELMLFVMVQDVEKY